MQSHLHTPVQHRNHWKGFPQKRKDVSPWKESSFMRKETLNCLDMPWKNVTFKVTYKIKKVFFLQKKSFAWVITIPWCHSHEGTLAGLSTASTALEGLALLLHSLCLAKNPLDYIPKDGYQGLSPYLVNSSFCGWLSRSNYQSTEI